MGNKNRKVGELPDEHTGLTETEMKLIQETWRNFCRQNREYGVLLFLSMFIKHPEYLKLFKKFHGRSVTVLKDDPVFRAHGCSVGYHITSMVESVQEPAIFEVLVRRNATEHLRRKGVKPYHFEVMGQCLVDVLQAKDERHMNPAAVDAWGKFLTCMVAIIKDVYEKAAAERADRASVASAASTRSLDDVALTSPFRTAVITSAESPEELETAVPSPTMDTSVAGTTITKAVAKQKLPVRLIGKQVGAAAANKEAQSAQTGAKTASPQQRALRPVVIDKEKSPAKEVITHTEQAH